MESNRPTLSELSNLAKNPTEENKAAREGITIIDIDDVAMRGEFSEDIAIGLLDPVLGPARKTHELLARLASKPFPNLKEVVGFNAYLHVIVENKQPRYNSGHDRARYRENDIFNLYLSLIRNFDGLENLMLTDFSDEQCRMIFNEVQKVGRKVTRLSYELNATDRDATASIAEFIASNQTVTSVYYQENRPNQSIHAVHDKKQSTPINRGVETILDAIEKNNRSKITELHLWVRHCSDYMTWIPGLDQKLAACSRSKNIFIVLSNDDLDHFEKWYLPFDPEYKADEPNRQLRKPLLKAQKALEQGMQLKLKKADDLSASFPSRVPYALTVDNGLLDCIHAFPKNIILSDDDQFPKIVAAVPERHRALFAARFLAEADRLNKPFLTEANERFHLLVYLLLAPSIPRELINIIFLYCSEIPLHYDTAPQNSLTIEQLCAAPYSSSTTMIVAATAVGPTTVTTKETVVVPTEEAKRTSAPERTTGISGHEPPPTLPLPPAYRAPSLSLVRR